MMVLDLSPSTALSLRGRIGRGWDSVVLAMSEDLRRAFRDNLKLLRLRRGLSQERFSVSMGHDRTWVGKLEKGTSNPQLATVEEVAAKLGMSPLDLLQPVSAEQIASVPELSHTNKMKPKES